MSLKSTITDVAKRADVSIKTVSRVLNGEPNVSAKTREKVQKAANALNYSPNLAARGLASSKSYMIALLYDIPSPGYLSAIQKGAVEACQEQGYHLVVQPIDGTNAHLTDDIKMLLRRLPVDGVILTSPLCDSGEVVSLLTQLNMPYVPITPTTSHGDVPFVRMDNAKAAHELTSALIEMGHVDIGFIKGPDSRVSSALRFQGYREAMRSAGQRINPDWIVDGAFTFTSGVSAAKQLLETDNRPTAIFASNDDMAAGVISVANQMGISVPNDLSVAGFDDTPLASIISPQLTTIQQPIRDMGYQAAQLIIPSPATERKNLTVYTLEHRLIIRESTGKHN